MFFIPLPPEPLPPPYHLREVQVTILNSSRCRELFKILSLHHLITKDVFCAGAEDGSADTCSVSVPGPLRKPHPPPAGWRACSRPAIGLLCFICEKSLVAFNYPAYKPTSHFPLTISSSPSSLSPSEVETMAPMKRLRRCGCQGEPSPSLPPHPHPRSAPCPRGLFPNPTHQTIKAYPRCSSG